MNIDLKHALAAFPAGFHEDDRLRSEFVRRLIMEGSTTACKTPTNISEIPKVLVRFWHDPKFVPIDVSQCLASWERLRDAGFEILTFHDDSAAAYINANFGSRQIEAFGRCHHPAMRSDYFRMCYLFSSGGFYVDADEVMTEGRWFLLYSDNRLKLQPLGYDIPSASMVPTLDLWRAEQPTANKIFYVNNNPLIAPAGHPVLKSALERATSALLDRGNRQDIQSKTGPGNLTAVLVAHARELALASRPIDFQLIRDWDQVAETQWELSYRADKRNWRNVDQW